MFLLLLNEGTKQNLWGYVLSVAIKLERILCTICQAEMGEKELFLIDNPSLSPRMMFTVVRCCECGLTYINPRPTPESLAQVYDDSIISAQLEVVPDQALPSLRSSIVAKISKGIVNERLKSLSRFMLLNAKTKVLDMGCGKGAFLYQLKKIFGSQVYGLELDPNCVQFCQEKLAVSTTAGRMEELLAPFENQKFNLVTMWHSLEHALDPLACLGNTFRYLADDGLLVVEVPNERSLENIIFRSKSFLYEAPFHLYDFDLRTLSLALNKAQFEVVKVEYPIGAGGWFGSFQRLLTKDRAFKNMADYLPFILALGALIFPLELILSFTRWGSVVRVYAKKKSTVSQTFPL